MSGTMQQGILAAERADGRRQALLVVGVLAICVVALAITGFFDAQRFAEGIPALT